jgi:D-serine deaminase-like pyridoxal phosphate-dependent protein
VPDLKTTSRLLARLGIARATLVLDVARARANIARFALRAVDEGVVFRPHHKTHQSAVVAEWMRTAGVTRATVSSMGQAGYFADHGWDDLTLAIGANPREAADYDALARRIRLGLCTDDPRTVAALAAQLTGPVDLWIEIDSGQGRGGVPATAHDRLADLVRAIVAAPHLRYAGLLTHAGHTYGAEPGTARETFAAVRSRLRTARARLALAGLPGGAISVGDTPGCAAADTWHGVDEVRPGNFVFFDLMQRDAGACADDELACAVACPVIGTYPDRGEIVVHAGAVHLSREALPGSRGPRFGELLTLAGRSFGPTRADWPVRSLSQEHAVVEATSPAAREELPDLAPGDLVLVAPVHSCLTCEQFGAYLTLGGERLARYRRA